MNFTGKKQLLPACSSNTSIEWPAVLTNHVHHPADKFRASGYTLQTMAATTGSCILLSMFDRKTGFATASAVFWRVVWQLISNCGWATVDHTCAISLLRCRSVVWKLYSNRFLTTLDLFMCSIWFYNLPLKIFTSVLSKNYYLYIAWFSIANFSNALSGFVPYKL